MVDGVFDYLTCKPKLTIKPDAVNSIDLEAKFDPNDSNLTLDITKGIRLPCNATDMSPQTLINYIWGFQNGVWMPQYQAIGHCDNYIRFKDANTGVHGNYVYGDLALIAVSNSGHYDPILTWSEGMVVKKDFSAGGFVTANQGLIALGSGMQNQFDPPGIWLTHDLKSALHDIEQRTAAQGDPSTPQQGRYPYFINKEQRTGRLANHLYQWDGATWVDRGPTSSYNYMFDTCYVRKSSYSIILNPEHRDGPPTSYTYGTYYYSNSNGHIYRYNGSTWIDMGSYVPNVPIQPYDLGNLACNIINAYSVQFGTDTNLFRDQADVLKTDDNLIVSQNLWCNTLAVNGIVGISGNTTLNNNTSIYFKQTDGSNGFRIHGASNNLAYIDMPSGNQLIFRSFTAAEMVKIVGPQLQIPTTGSGAGLLIGGDVQLYRGATNTLYVSGNIDPAAGTETGNLGEGGRYWYGLVARFVYYKTLTQFFDLYDDLAIAKLWGEKNQTLPDDYDGTKQKPPADDPFKILKGNKENANTEEFYDAGKVNSFLMSCVKALAKKQDEHDASLLKMMNDMDALRAHVAA